MGIKTVLAGLAVAATAGLLAACGPAGSGGGGLGEEGEPINLTVGYQPYYTAAFSGVVMREKELWKKHLPEGSTVNFQVGLQGSIITSQMLAGKQQIGYTGDMPSITATTKRDIRDIRIVGTLGLSHDQCHTMVVRKDAPQFKSQEEAVKWMEGKRVASPHGSCSDRFARESFKQLGINPASYLNQSFEVIASSFENGKLDAASIWEPPASKLVEEGLARHVATGNMNDLRTSAFVLMSKELIDQRPDVAEGWLKAELEAQQFYADPENAMEVARMAVDQTQGYSAREMWDSFRKNWPLEQGGNPADIRLKLPFTPKDPEVQSFLASEAEFLKEIKAIGQAPPENAVDASFADKVLKDAGAENAGVIKALPASEFKGGSS
jgi:NitT/TauT family transport system substrate-binding protein